MMGKRAIAFGFMTFALSSLFGCSGGRTHPEIGAPEDITGLSLNYSDMTMTSFFSFEMRDNGGVILFSCWYYDEDGEEVKHEDMSIASAYMQELREFVKEYAYVDLQDEDPAKRKELICDAASCTLELQWADRSPRQVRSMDLPPGGEELKAFFVDIAQKYAKSIEVKEMQ